MGLFGKKKKKEDKKDKKEEQKYTGHVGCMSEDQAQCLADLKQFMVAELQVTSDRYNDDYLLRF